MREKQSAYVISSNRDSQCPRSVALPETMWLALVVGGILFLFFTRPADAEYVAATRTDWVYLQATPTNPICHTDEMSAALAQIEHPTECNTFDHWITQWPNTHELNAIQWAHCEPPDLPMSPGWGHKESRQYAYTSGACSGPGSPNSVWLTRQFWYLCPSGYSYYIPPGQGGNATPVCYKAPDTRSPRKQPRDNDCCNIGNPINIATAEKYQRESDYIGMGRFPLKFERHYSGGQWRHTYQRSLELTPLVDNPPYLALSVWANREDGRGIPFTVINRIVEDPDPDVVERLEVILAGNVQTGWRLRDSQDNVELYDLAGRLLSITDGAGITQVLTYDASQHLSYVTDSFGRRLQFGYDAAGRLASVTDPAGGMYLYGYDSSGNLSSVTDPNTKVRSYHYNEVAQTAGANLPHALTGIVDEAGQRFATFSYDSVGRAVETTHANGSNRYTVAYNATGSRTVTDPANVSRTISLVAKHGVQKIAAVDGPPCTNCGLAASYAYDSNGNLIDRYDFKGVRTYQQFSNDGRNLLTGKWEASGTPLARSAVTTWHPTLRVPMQHTASGRRTKYTRDAHGNVLTREVADMNPPYATRTWTYTYNNFGQVLTADGPRTDVPDVTTYTYYTCDTGYQCGQVQTVTNPLGQVTTYNTYNAHGQPLVMTDPNGVVTTLTYDPRQRLASRLVGTELTSFGYWPTGLLKKVTLPDGSYLNYAYDAAHRLTGIADSEGSRIAYTLDTMGNRTAEQMFDPANSLTQTRSRVFNTLNQLWKEIDAAGTANVTTTFGYDNNGNQTSVNAPLGRNTGQAYDELNRLTQVTDPSSGLTQYGYNALDQLISVTDPRNLVTNYTYNALGDLTQQVSPDTGTTTNAYDSGGNLATRVDARGKTATYAYDALNRVTSVVYPDQTISYTYDMGTNQKGHLTRITDATGSTSWSYDPQGRVLARQQSMGVTKTLSYNYDLSGRLQVLTLPSGHTVTYGYTAGKATSLTLDGLTTILSDVLYQPFGPTRGWTWGNSTIAVREYDADGRTLQLDSAGLKTYTYDDASRIAAITDSDDPSLSSAYQYDAADRLTAVLAQPSATPIFTLSTTSVAPGQSVAVTLNGVPTSSGYWLALASTTAPFTTYSRWVAVAPNGGSFVWNVSMPSIAGTYEVRLFKVGFVKLASGAPITVTTPPPLTQAALNVGASAAAPGASVTVRLTDGPGGSTDWLAFARVGAPNTAYVQWVYVGAGVANRDWTVTMPTTEGDYEFRLFLQDGHTRAATSAPVLLTDDAPVSGSGASASSSYTYDLTGNRLSDEHSIYTIQSVSNRLQAVAGAINRTYSYDAAGNTTSDGAVTYGYDDAGRMVSAMKAGVTATYKLNALGQRVRKAVGGTSTYFVYDEAGRLVGEYDNSGNLIQETVWFGEIPVATLKPNGSGGVNVFYIHTDHLNTPRRISRPSDNVVVWRWDSDPFGTSVANEDPDGDTQSFVYNLRFPGQYYDSETGLHYNYFRDYDPATGRYVQSDPIGLMGGINTYAYVRGNPVTYTDPKGLELLPPNPDRNTVICDGSGSMISQLQPMSPINEKCISDCMMQHELTHIDQLIQAGRGRTCRGAARGMRVQMPQNDIGQNENAAYQVERDCLQRKLQALPSCDECRSPIAKRLKSIEGL